MYFLESSDVNHEFLKGFANRLKSKWNKLGKALKIPKKDLESFTSFNQKESYINVLKVWKQKKTVPYTWEVFFDALRAIEEENFANQIMGMY